MRILLLHPNYHSGRAEIAGNWPPAWVAHLTGYLKAAGYTDVHFVDAMTNHLGDDQARQRIVDLRPDIVGCTAITPAIYKAEGLLQIAKSVNPAIVTVLGGIHGTFMYPQRKEAPWIDAVLRGDGEQVFLNLVRAVDDGSFARDPGSVRGTAFLARDVEGGGEAAAQLKLDRFNKETTIEQNKKAIRLLREAGIVTDAQFIVGLENETAETLEETCRMARDWKPDAMDRGELLDRVMHNYRRFFMNKALFQYPFTKGKTRRSYLMGCLKAFAKCGFPRTFYDLGKVGDWGPQTKKTVDFGFADARVHGRPDAEAIGAADEARVTMHGPKIERRRRKGEARAADAIAALPADPVSACGGGKEQLGDEAPDLSPARLRAARRVVP